MAVAERWEKAVQLASGWELRNKQQKILDDVWELTKSLATQRITKRLLNNLLSNSIGEELKGENFQKFCSDWLEGKKNSRATAESTLRRYKSIIDGFLARLPEKRRCASVSSMTVAEIERFRNSEIQVGKTAGTANFGVKVLRAVFNTARRQGVISTNPAEAVELLLEEPEERLPFDEEQIKALLAAAKGDRQWIGMVLFAVHAGLRLTDSANLTWNNIDLAGRTLTFRAKKTGKRTKKDTVIALHQDIVNYLDSLPVNDVPGQSLFPSLAGRQSGSHAGLSNTFNRLIQKARIRVPVGAEKEGKGRRFQKLGFHSLRHSFISRLANSEVPVDLRRMLAGHSSDQIHRRYVYLDLSLQEKAIGKLPSVL